ncbi:hypothetical protein COFA105466_04165 [Corynebacterium falsenii]
MPTDRHSADDADHNQSTSGEQSSHNTTATVIPEVDSDSSETSAASSSRPSHSQRPANSQSRNVEESAKAEAPEDSEVFEGSQGSEDSQRSADTADTSESEEGKDQQKLKKLPTWSLAILAIGALYMLLVAIGVIGDGFKEMGSDTAKGLFDFAPTPSLPCSWAFWRPRSSSLHQRRRPSSSPWLPRERCPWRSPSPWSWVRTSAHR